MRGGLPPAASVERAAMILAGDIGGTNTRLILVREGGTPHDRVFDRRYSSREPGGLIANLERFLAEAPQRPTTAAFGVAGPVLDGRAVGTNLGFTVDERELAGVLKVDRVAVRNDLQTTGYGVAWLKDDQVHVLNEGSRRPGNAALIAAGTGLGESILVARDGGFQPLPSEGGHAEFAPRDELQDALLKHLRTRFGAVSWERVVSGPGLVNVHGFLATLPGRAETAETEAEFAQRDRAEVISKHGIDGRSPLCAEAVALFVRLYGAEAGNLALKALALGGVFVGGGIAPKILPALRRFGFFEAFCGAGVLAELLRTIPVRVILEPDTSLLGAAALALEAARAP